MYDTNDYKLRCKQLEEEIEFLKERIKILVKLDQSLPLLNMIFQIPASQSFILSMMMGREVVTRDMVMQNMYAHKPDNSINPKIIDVWVFHLRKKLKQFDITISTQWGNGYYLTSENKQKIRDLTQSLKDTLSITADKDKLIS